MRPARTLIPALLALTLTGCVATIHERYFLSAYDPRTDVTNFFRIGIDGSTHFSKARYSVGFYDREAVQKLFGENSIHQEYLATSVDVFDPETGDRLHDLSDRLAAAALGRREYRAEHLYFANASVAELIGQYETRISLSHEHDVYLPSLERAKTARVAAQAILDTWKTEGGDPWVSARASIAEALADLSRSSKDEEKAAAAEKNRKAAATSLGTSEKAVTDKLKEAETALGSKKFVEARAALEAARQLLLPRSSSYGGMATAAANLREAQAILEAIRIAIDSDVLVRFFSADGLEIDVTSKTLVIFVATDISRFAEALRQLARSEDASRDLLLTVLGPRIDEARRLSAAAKTSSEYELALDKRLADRLVRLKTEIDAATTPAVKAKLIDDALFGIAATTAGRTAIFDSAESIRSYVEGRRGAQ